MPKSECNSTQAKKIISRHPIGLTGSDYDYILEEICRWDKIEFEIDVGVCSDDVETLYDNFKWILYLFLIYLYINYHQIFIYFSSVSFLMFSIIYMYV